MSSNEPGKATDRLRLLHRRADVLHVNFRELSGGLDAGAISSDLTAGGSRKMGFSTSSVSRCSMAATTLLASGRPSEPRRATSIRPGCSGSANSGAKTALIAVARGVLPHRPLRVLGLPRLCCQSRRGRKRQTISGRPAGHVSGAAGGRSRALCAELPALRWGLGAVRAWHFEAATCNLF